MRIYLSVPYAEKDIAKSNGARWDPIAKRWFLDAPSSNPIFRKWLTVDEVRQELKPNIRAYRCYLAEGQIRCWSCVSLVDVYAIVLPKWHLSYEDGRWEKIPDMTLISYVHSLPERVAEIIGDLTSTYYLDTSKTAESKYWMNHCSDCDARIGDFYALEEVGSPFSPADFRSAQKTVLWHIPGDVAICCGGVVLQEPSYIDCAPIQEIG